jgi:hypothetical protein
LRDNSEVFRSYETGVDQPVQYYRHYHHHHHPHAHQHNHYQTSMSEVDNADRMSIKSATFSGGFRSEDSLAGRGAGNGGLGGAVGGAGGSVSGKLGSLPPSPFVRRTSKSNSFSSHARLLEKYGACGGGANRKQPLVLFTYLDAQEHLPYADDSAAVTPKSELNGGIVVDTPTRFNLARKFSYTSHTGKVDSYDSHTDLRYQPGSAGVFTKEGALLRKKMAAMFADPGSRSSSSQPQPSKHNSILMEPMLPPAYDSKSTYYGGAGASSTGAGSPYANNGKKDSVDLQVSEESALSPFATLADQSAALSRFRSPSWIRPFAWRCELAI